jgi:hypothetical protein
MAGYPPMVADSVYVPAKIFDLFNESNIPLASSCRGKILGMSVAGLTRISPGYLSFELSKGDVNITPPSSSLSFSGSQFEGYSI